MLIEIYKKLFYQLTNGTDEEQEKREEIYRDTFLEQMGKIIGACEIYNLKAEFRSNLVIVYDLRGNIVLNGE